MPCSTVEAAGSETSLTSADLGQTFTVDCWVKPDSRQNTHADILGNHEHGGVGFVIQQDGAGANRYRASYGTGSDRWVLSRPVQLHPPGSGST